MNDIKKHRRLVIQRLLILTVAVLCSYAVGRMDEKALTNEQIEKLKNQRDLIEIYSDMEWRTNNLLHRCDVDSTCAEFLDYQACVIRLVEFVDKHDEFYNDLNN